MCEKAVALPRILTTSPWNLTGWIWRTISVLILQIETFFNDMQDCKLFFVLRKETYSSKGNKGHTTRNLFDLCDFSLHILMINQRACWSKLLDLACRKQNFYDKTIWNKHTKMLHVKELAISRQQYLPGLGLRPWLMDQNDYNDLTLLSSWSWTLLWDLKISQDLRGLVNLLLWKQTKNICFPCMRT